MIDCTAPVLPQRIGKYRVIRRLGEGTTSEVFLCHDSFNEREVAIRISAIPTLHGTKMVLRLLDS